MKKVLFLLFITCLCFGCKKESLQKHCWQIVDNNGNDLTLICNKTESEVVNCTTCGTMNGSPNWNLQPCNYFCVDCDEPTYCWHIDNSFHIANKTEKWINCHFPGSSKVKVDCNYNCDNWYTRIKSTYKPTGNTTFSAIFPRREYCADSAVLFNSPNIIIIKDNADSLIVLQRSKSGLNFY